jgi:hypothetical protein
VNALLAILNVFFNPAETVRRIRGNKLAWLPPVVLGGVIMGLYNYALPRATLQAMRNEPPAGMDTAKLDALTSSMEAMARFSTISAPMMFALMILIGSALIFAMCVILRVNVRFPDLYNLMAHVGLINAVQTLAHWQVLRAKGAGILMKDLTPAFGLEGMLAPDASKFLHGLAGFFSVFTLWHIAMLVLGFAALSGLSKARAFLVTAPSWALGMVYAVIVTLAR